MSMEASTPPSDGAPRRVPHRARLALGAQRQGRVRGVSERVFRRISCSRVVAWLAVEDPIYALPAGIQDDHRNPFIVSIPGSVESTATQPEHRNRDLDRSTDCRGAGAPPRFTHPRRARRPPGSTPATLTPYTKLRGHWPGLRLFWAPVPSDDTLLLRLAGQPLGLLVITVRQGNSDRLPVGAGPLG